MTQTALITGASRGIGLAIAELLTKKGVKIIAPSREEMNLFSNDSIDAYLNSLNFKIDIIINNAGINPIALAKDLTDENINDTLQINYIAPLRICRALIPQMVEQKNGRIVNISSIWSEISKPGRTIYSSTKAAINGMTRTMAVELAKDGILVNAVAPGFVNTDLTRQNNSPDEIKVLSEAIPIKRLAEPDEIAELVAFLVSPQNSYITGQTIFIDGGYTCQ